MPTQLTNYKCPACTGPLHFSSATGKLECDYCGSSFTPEEIEALYAQQEESAQEAYRPEEAEQTAAETVTAPAGAASAEEQGAHVDSKWDDSTISASWGEAAGKMRAYNCPSCGAQLICEETTAATQCPYCGNPTIVPGQFKDALKPDYIIPFAIDKNAAVAALKAHYRKRPFLPRTFSNNNQIQKLQGIYVPFWLFDADVSADCIYEGTRSTTHREGNYRVTRTDHFHVERAGSVRFERIPTDASKKMPDDLMDSLEPFDYGGIKPFSTAYLPGYLADKYDVSIDQNARRADKRCETTTLAAMRQDVSGYMSVVNRNNNVHIGRGKVHYALLPVWVLKTKWQNKDFLFAMNGQTGKFVGDLPVSKSRFLGCFAGLTALLTVLFTLLGVGRFLAQIFLG